MNSLSIFLLASDLIPRFFILGVVLLCFSGVLFFLLPEKGVEMFSSDHCPFMGITRKEPYVLLIVSLVFMFASPSKETIRLIAASQVGEQIIQLEEVQQLGGETAELARVSIEALRNMISQTLPTETKAE